MPILVVESKVARARRLAHLLQILAGKIACNVPLQLLRYFRRVYVPLTLALPIVRFYTQSRDLDLDNYRRVGREEGADVSGAVRVPRIVRKISKRF